MHSLSSGSTHCDEKGTLDEMATLVGWSPAGTEQLCLRRSRTALASSSTNWACAGEVLYLEQNGTEVSLFAMRVSQGSFDAFSRVLTPELTGGVIGGGFRASSRPSITPSGMMGLSWESSHTPIQAYVAKLTGTSLTSIRQLSSLNAEAVNQTWPAVSTHTWDSDDGTTVSGLLVHSTQAAHETPPPLIVFTHCGPAMAMLSTFIGAGTVCARFPITTWAQRGYNILMPNYRGSTGYGREFRRADLNGWGAGDYEDVMSGFVSLAKSGFANLTRCAHVGWSYGGD